MTIPSSIRDFALISMISKPLDYMWVCQAAKPQHIVSYFAFVLQAVGEALVKSRNL